MAWSPVDTDLLALGNMDHTIWIWDTGCDPPVAVAGTMTERPIAGLEFDPTGNFLFLATGHKVKVWEWRAPQLLEPALQRKNEKHKDRRVNVRHLRKTITPRIINGVTQPALVPPPARVPAAVLALRAARAPRAARLAAAAAVTWAGTQAQPAPGITARNAAGNAANAAVDDGFHSESMEDEPEPVSGQVSPAGFGSPVHEMDMDLPVGDPDDEEDLGSPQRADGPWANGYVANSPPPAMPAPAVAAPAMGVPAEWGALTGLLPATGDGSLRSALRAAGGGAALHVPGAGAGPAPSAARDPLDDLLRRAMGCVNPFGLGPLAVDDSLLPGFTSPPVGSLLQNGSSRPEGYQLLDGLLAEHTGLFDYFLPNGAASGAAAPASRPLDADAFARMMTFNYMGRPATAAAGAAGGSNAPGNGGAAALTVQRPPAAAAGGSGSHNADAPLGVLDVFDRVRSLPPARPSATVPAPSTATTSTTNAVIEIDQSSDDDIIVMGETLAPPRQPAAPAYLTPHPSALRSLGDRPSSSTFVMTTAPRGDAHPRKLLRPNDSSDDGHEDAGGAGGSSAGLQLALAPSGQALPPVDPRRSAVEPPPVDPPRRLTRRLRLGAHRPAAAIAAAQDDDDEEQQQPASPPTRATRNDTRPLLLPAEPLENNLYGVGSRRPRPLWEDEENLLDDEEEAPYSPPPWQRPQPRGFEDPDLEVWPTVRGLLRAPVDPRLQQPTRRPTMLPPRPRVASPAIGATDDEAFDGDMDGADTDPESPLELPPSRQQQRQQQGATAAFAGNGGPAAQFRRAVDEYGAGVAVNGTAQAAIHDSDEDDDVVQSKERQQEEVTATPEEGEQQKYNPKTVYAGHQHRAMRIDPIGRPWLWSADSMPPTAKLEVYPPLNCLFPEVTLPTARIKRRQAQYEKEQAMVQPEDGEVFSDLEEGEVLPPTVAQKMSRNARRRARKRLQLGTTIAIATFHKEFFWHFARVHQNPAGHTTVPPRKDKKDKAKWASQAQARRLASMLRPGTLDSLMMRLSPQDAYCLAEMEPNLLELARKVYREKGPVSDVLGMKDPLVADYLIRLRRYKIDGRNRGLPPVQLLAHLDPLWGSDPRLPNPLRSRELPPLSLPREPWYHIACTLPSHDASEDVFSGEPGRIQREPMPMPCLVNLKLWEYDPADPQAMLRRMDLHLTHVLMPTESCVALSPCGTFVAVVVACRPPEEIHLRNAKGSPVEEIKAAIRYKLTYKQVAPRKDVGPIKLLYELRLYNLAGPEHFGACIRSRILRGGACLSSLSISPCSQFLVVTYSKPHSGLRAYDYMNKERQFIVKTAMEVYRLSDFELVRVMTSTYDSIHTLCWHPVPGTNLVYGTRNGQVRIMTPDRTDRADLQARISAINDRKQSCKEANSTARLVGERVLGQMAPEFSAGLVAAGLLESAARVRPAANGGNGRGGGGGNNRAADEAGVAPLEVLMQEQGDPDVGAAMDAVMDVPPEQQEELTAEYALQENNLAQFELEAMGEQFA